MIINSALTDGFAFVEFATPDPSALIKIWELMGFVRVARHKTLPVALYGQGQIYFVLNELPHGHAAEFAALHGPAAVAAGFYCHDPVKLAERATRQNYKILPRQAAWIAKSIDAVVGVGGSLIYLCPADAKSSFFADDFIFESDPTSHAIGLQSIDHLSFNVTKGSLDDVANMFKTLFGFRETRYFHIQGKQTALRSRALQSGCSLMRITINESMDDQSQIAEFIDAYKGAGIQHIALNPVDIYATVEAMTQKGIPFVPVPESYYRMLQEKFPDSGENIARMQKNFILLDGVNDNRELLLQIVTPPIVGPMFFEVIQRKGCEGFGEGNFTALFEALERDQIARGVLQAA